MREWLDLNLRSIGQVIFQNNPWTGLVFILGMGWSAFVTNNANVLIGALIGLIISNLTARILKADNKFLGEGMYGFNGFLLGAAILTFFVPSTLIFSLLILGAAISGLVMLIFLEKTKTPFQLPVLTAPFVVLTWIIFVVVMNSAPELLIKNSANPQVSSEGIFFFSHSVLRSFSQVFLIENSITGVLFILALLVSSLAATSFALWGAVLAVVMTFFANPNLPSLEAGLSGYSAILVAVALGNVFLRTSFKSSIYASLGVALALVIQNVLGSLMAPWGIPILTAPFVLAVWIMLFLRRVLLTDKLF